MQTVLLPKNLVDDETEKIDSDEPEGSVMRVTLSPEILSVAKN
jgi:hypothetical protein